MAKKVSKKKKASRSSASAKKSHPKKTAKRIEKALSYDLGGTKVAVGIVDSRGRVLEELREPIRLQEGQEAFIAQLATLGGSLLERYPEVRRVGVASAGPLDIHTGELLDPTNFSSEGEDWRKFPIASLLSKRLRRPVLLENDAAAAILAEHWMGAAKGYADAIILTLGTGVGNGIIVDNALVRSGRDVHPEASHAIINFDDLSAPCGCGNFGCAEAYLSGRNFAKRAGVMLGNPTLTAKDIADLARSGDARALSIFEEYALIMAVTVQNLVVVYAPQIVVFTGSFAVASDLWMSSTRAHLEKFLARRRVGVDLLPKLALSTLNNQAGIIGGAFVAFDRSR